MQKKLNVDYYEKLNYSNENIKLFDKLKNEIKINTKQMNCYKTKGYSDNEILQIKFNAKLIGEMIKRNNETGTDTVIFCKCNKNSAEEFFAGMTL